MERVFSLMTQREPTLDDTEKLEQMRQRKIENDLNMKMLFAEVVADPAYRATELGDGENASENGHHRYAWQPIEDLTGFVFRPVMSRFWRRMQVDCARWREALMGRM